MVGSLETVAQGLITDASIRLIDPVRSPNCRAYLGFYPDVSHEHTASLAAPVVSITYLTTITIEDSLCLEPLTLGADLLARGPYTMVTGKAIFWVIVLFRC